MLGFATSRSEALRLIKQGGVYKNNVRVTPPDELLFSSDFFYGTYCLIRRGKKQAGIIKVGEPDETAPETLDWLEFTYKEDRGDPGTC